jgi:hypothetical protein
MAAAGGFRIVVLVLVVFVVMVVSWRGSTTEKTV